MNETERRETTMTDYNSLAELLSPVSIDSFVTQHFSTRPLYVKGHPDRFAGLFDRADFDRIASTGRVRVRCLFRDDQERIIRETGERPTITLAPDDIPSARSSGATVFITGLQREHGPVAKVTAMLKQSLGFTGTVRATAWNSAARAGIAPHFDAGASFIFQVEGRKVWRLSKRPALPFPRTCGLQMSDGEVVFEAPAGASAAIEPWEEHPEPFDEKDAIEVVLEPGDLLYVPFGTWHGTRADDDGPSLSVNVHLEPIDVGELLFGALRAKLRERPSWRGTFAAECGADMPPTVLQWFRARLAELPAELEALSKSTEMLERAWKMRVAEFEGRSPRPTGDVNAVRRVRLSSERPVTAAIETDDGTARSVTFWCGSDEIVFDEPELLDAASRLARRESVEAEELTREAVAVLLERGLVEGC